MDKSLRFILISFFIFKSCVQANGSKTIYSYGGVSITRTDIDRVSYFYYGDFSDKKTDTASSNIRAEYKLGSNIMNGYLVFKPDGKVILVTASGNFFQKHSDSLFTTFSFVNNVDFIHWKDSIALHCDNWIRISHVIKYEDKIYKDFGSAVLVERTDLNY
jgi:hypothetical protein